MRRLAMVAAALIGSMAGAAAMDENEAFAWLQGSWRGDNETFVFEGQNWTQFLGGKRVDTTYAIEPMPENLFVLISNLSQKRYVVHAHTPHSTMAWYLEGETRQDGFYQRSGPN